MSKSNFPVTRPKSTSRVNSRSSATKASIRSVEGFSPIPCACECGGTFTPRDARQKYLPGHRYSAYTTHRCAECGVMHRQGVNK